MAGRILEIITCRRRKVAETQEVQVPPVYKELLRVGKKVTEEEGKKYEAMAFWTNAQTDMGARIFVVAPKAEGDAPSADFFCDMWRLLSYCFWKMHNHVVVNKKSFAIVWCMFGNSNLLLWEPRRMSNCMHPAYHTGLDVVHVVHPSWAVRILRVALWPLATDEFWEKFYAHERVEFLQPAFDVKKLGLPKHVFAFDKYLDEQAREMSQKAAKEMGGSMGNLGDDAGSQELNKLLQRKGQKAA